LSDIIWGMGKWPHRASRRYIDHHGSKGQALDGANANPPKRAIAAESTEDWSGLLPFGDSMLGRPPPPDFGSVAARHFF
jgi:hypothetical protein